MLLLGCSAATAFVRLPPFYGFISYWYLLVVLMNSCYSNTIMTSCLNFLDVLFVSICFDDRFCVPCVYKLCIILLIVALCFMSVITSFTGTNKDI